MLTAAQRLVARFGWVLPLAAALLCTWPVLRGGFTNDDELLILNNPRAHGFDQVRENLTGDFFHTRTAFRIGYYRPLVKLLFLVEYRCFGASPRGYHAVSIALFLLAIGFAWLLLRRLGHSVTVVLLATLLLATHPGQAECVAIIASQSDPLAVALVGASLWSYLRWRDGGARLWLPVALGLDLLALAAKEVAVVVLPLVVLGELLGEPRPPRRELLQRLARAAWFLLPLAAYVLTRVGLGALPVGDEIQLAPLERLLRGVVTAVSLLLRAMVPLAWPPYLHGAAPIFSTGALALRSAALAAPLLVLGAAAWRWPRMRWAALLLVLPILPVLPGNVIHTSNDARLLAVSDRWVLLPALGAALLLALLIVGAASRAGRASVALVALAGGVLAVSQGLGARLENASFRDEPTRMLWVGEALRERGGLTEAEREQVLAAEAVAADRRHDRVASVALYRQLLDSSPADYNRRFNLAVALAEAGRDREALYHALTVFHGASPDGKVAGQASDSFHRNRSNRAFLVGLLLERLGRKQEALGYYRRCLAVDPEHALARRHAAGVVSSGPSRK